MARQYQRIQPEPTRFFSLKYGYHGTHFGGAPVNGMNQFRQQYEPVLPGCHHLPAPPPIGTSSAPRTLPRSRRASPRASRRIALCGADTTSAFIMEPVLGSGGVLVPHETLMPMMCDICTRNGILMIADDVICRFGRTGADRGSRLWGAHLSSERYLTGVGDGNTVRFGTPD